MGMPARLQAAITSGSLTEPPGWMMAAIWALAASSIESGKGKKASLERTAPGRTVAGLFQRDLNRVDPAHLSRSGAEQHPVSADGNGVRFHVPHDRKSESQIGPLLGAGPFAVTTFHSLCGSASTSAS